MSKFRTLPLEDCLDSLLDYRGKSPPKAEIGIPVISAKVVKDGRISRDIKQKIEPSFYPVWMTRGLPEIGDVIFTTEGPLGEVAQLDAETVGFALGQRIVALRGKKGIVDNTFLKFLLLSPQQQEILASYATGTTVEGISQKALRRVPISIPSYSDQVAIGSLLGALDDKIDLNHRMNETLEAMARALFKDWFVDFGPVRAKMDGRHPPGLAADIAALFPDALDEEGKPVGWTSGNLADIAKSRNNGVLPSEVLADTPYIGLEHMPRRSIALSTWDNAGKVTSNKSVFSKNDILFGKLRPYFHKVGVAPLDGICSTDIIVLGPRNPSWAAYVLSCVSSDEFVAYTDQTSDGTKMPRTSWAAMARYPLSLPDTGLAAIFNEFVQPMLESVLANIHESRTLGSLRDLLLPKLLSGEIRIKDAEQLIGEAL